MIDLPKNTTPIVLVGDVLERLKEIPPKSIDVIITSPPYYQQREYNVEKEIGQEKSPEEYINKMVKVGDALRRVLKDSGSYFLNIGDKYLNRNLQMIPFKLASEMQKNGWLVRNVIVWHKHPNPMPTSVKNRFNDIWEPIIFFIKDSGKYYTYNYYFNLDPLRVPHKTKSEIDLPLTISEEKYQKMKGKIKERNNNGNSSSKFIGHENNKGASPGARMVLYGEYYTKQRKHNITKELETEIIKYLKKWKNERGMTISDIAKKSGVKKTTVGHWFRLDPGRSLPSSEHWLKLKEVLGFDKKYDKIMTEEHYVLQTVKPHPKGKNPGDIWRMAPGKLKEAHFSIFPEELPRRIITACCPSNGIVLDPFGGSGTTGKVARELNKRSILIDAKEEYTKIMKKRCGDIKIIY